jgi:hypothetical protein
MNAAFELPPTEVSDRTNPNVGLGSPKVVAITEKLLETEARKAARR